MLPARRRRHSSRWEAGVAGASIRSVFRSLSYAPHPTVPHEGGGLSIRALPLLAGGIPARGGQGQCGDPARGSGGKARPLAMTRRCQRMENVVHMTAEGIA